MSITADEWRNRSLNGEVCARMGCGNSPTYQCPKCNIHYCHEHVGSHFHETSQDEIRKEEEDIEKIR